MMTSRLAAAVVVAMVTAMTQTAALRAGLMMTSRLAAAVAMVTVMAQRAALLAVSCPPCSH